MEAADADFTKGLRYLFAAMRCESWAGNETTESQLGRLASDYRRRSLALMDMTADDQDELAAGRSAGCPSAVMLRPTDGVGATPGEEDAAPGLPGHVGYVRQRPASAQGGERRSQDGM